MVSKGNHAQMALFQVSEILKFTHIYILVGSLEHDLFFPYIGNNHPN